MQKDQARQSSFVLIKSYVLKPSILYLGIAVTVFDYCFVIGPCLMITAYCILRNICNLRNISARIICCILRNNFYRNLYFAQQNFLYFAQHFFGKFVFCVTFYAVLLYFAEQFLEKSAFCATKFPVFCTTFFGKILYFA